MWLKCLHTSSVQESDAVNGVGALRELCLVKDEIARLLRRRRHYNSGVVLEHEEEGHDQTLLDLSVSSPRTFLTRSRHIVRHKIPIRETRWERKFDFHLHNPRTALE